MSDPNSSSTKMHGNIRFFDVLMIGGGMAVLLLVIYFAIREFFEKLRRVRQQNERHRKLVVHEKVIIEDLPRFVYDGGRDGGGGGGQFQKVSDCSVCLGEVMVGEEVRVLPNCSHMFHVDCIDQWLYSHSTCPVCRVVIVAPPHSVDVVVE